MRTLPRLIPAEAIELVDQHGAQALLIARTHLAQARDAGDEVRAARWQTVSDAVAALLETRKPDAPHTRQPENLPTEQG
ncbi:hypothetical protein [Gluconacetobacter takamatsuzukensis]|uniref:Uncharacterized protein n=1 Tax=Gluconacetobacter takamatsuzukensis TaxID=1286190 RepID=A0A7W4KD22_9PROT|nr:hypothetical protein [Gluconacetobacter takamatsuzukensis]MBB2204722.1 hypothetical protein [Gluconacetobacter takamatsuzukensis]